MATKKVEEKSKKSKKSQDSSNSKKVMSKTKKQETKSKVDNKEEVLDRVEEELNKEKIVCDNCGEKYLSSLDRCPNCGYSIHDEDFEEFDDEDEMKSDDKKATKIEKKKQKKEIKKENKIKKTKKRRKQRNDVLGDSFKEQNSDLFNLIKIIIVVIIFVVIMYVIIAAVNGEFSNVDKTDDSEQEEAATIQNEKILASSIFDKEDKEYYVLAYNSDDVWAEYYSTIYSNYASIEDENVIPLFWVDLNDGFNSDILVEKGKKTNKNAQAYDELKIKSPTLIHIKKGKNVNYWEDDKVAETLLKITKKYNDSQEIEQE